MSVPEETEDLAAARGFLLGCVIGLVMWVALFGIVRFL